MNTRYKVLGLISMALSLVQADLTGQNVPKQSTNVLQKENKVTEATPSATIIPPNTIEISNGITNAKSELGEDHLYVGPYSIPLIIYPYTSYYGSYLSANRLTIGGANSSLNVDIGANPYLGSSNFGHIAVDNDQGVEKGHLTVSNFSGGTYGIMELWGDNGFSNITLTSRDFLSDYGRIVVHDDAGQNTAEMTVADNKAGLILTLQNGARRTETGADADGGYMKFYSTHGTQALLSFDNTGTFQTTQISDIRLKENIKVMNGILPKILQLQPSFYNYRDCSPDRPTFGLIAQNVQTVFPELVSPINDLDYLGVDYTRLGVLNTQAIKEQQLIIDELRKTQQQLLERIIMLEEILLKTQTEN